VLATRSAAEFKRSPKKNKGCKGLRNIIKRQKEKTEARKKTATLRQIILKNLNILI
jgi:hypothetical protein